MLATYSGVLSRPSILSDAIPTRTKSGSTSMPLRSCGLRRYLRSPRGTCFPSLIKSYGMRQAWAHSPRLAERPPRDSLVRHCPEYATHKAPWTNTSRGSATEPAPAACWAAWIFSISFNEHSRAKTTSSHPSSRAKSTPAMLLTVICVEAWMGKSGDNRRINRQIPTSCTMAASTPAEIMVRR